MEGRRMSLTFKRHYRLLVWMALVLAVLTVFLGDQRIIAYTVQGNDVSLFSDTAVQSLRKIVSDANLRRAVADESEAVAQVGSYAASTLLLVEADGSSR
jgi:hypothetical protein